MNQRRSMKQFNQGSSTVGGFFDLAGNFGTQKHEHGSHLFAFSPDYEAHNAIEQGITAFYGAGKFFLKKAELLTDKTLNGLHEGHKSNQTRGRMHLQNRSKEALAQ